MSETALFAFVILVSIIATALGYVISSLVSRHKIDDLKQKYVDLNNKLDNQKTNTSEKFSTVEKMREDLESSLSTLISDDPESPADLSDKKKFIATLLSPLQDSLRSADKQAKRIIREGQKVQLQIQKQLDILHAPQQLGRGDVKEIAKHLADEESRDLWGIQTLKKLLELTFMTDHYRMSEPGADSNTPHSPPCLIKLPNNSRVSIDINAPLEAYINICQAPDSSIRAWHSESHARKLRERIMEMSSRAYTSQYKEQPAAQILMILNDHYLATALEIDSDLLRLAQKNNLILATPTDLFNLLQTVSFGWRQQEFTADAKKIRETGIHLYKRFGTFIKLIAELGSELSDVLNSYNRAVSVFGSTAARAEKRMQDGAEINNPLDDEEPKRKSA
ncbi:MAG TPA: DNA recombination protein RmuC [Candidatus Tenderia electrophaga]|uniref:DNA recombination protein RmuC n=1 Tax=Candidatus Tenderia electrophaga TaxID=1748243 RepID=A0A832J834_9GAMM|nr:DNA recombination protein RmuC [Candidatus Tenderia electrophaga]